MAAGSPTDVTMLVAVAEPAGVRSGETTPARSAKPKASAHQMTCSLIRPGRTRTDRDTTPPAWSGAPQQTQSLPGMTNKVRLLRRRHP